MFLPQDILCNGVYYQMLVIDTLVTITNYTENQWDTFLVTYYYKLTEKQGPKVEEL